MQRREFSWWIGYVIYAVSLTFLCFIVKPEDVIVSALSFIALGGVALMLHAYGFQENVIKRVVILLPLFEILIVNKEQALNMILKLI